MVSLPHPGPDLAVADLLEALIAIPSVNPVYDPASEGEAPVATAIARHCTDFGCRVSVEPVVGARANVSAVLGDPAAPRLMIEGHIDTVGGQLSPVTRRAEGRLYGRGACDAKGGIAATLIALQRISTAGGLRSTSVEFLGAVDEEYRFRGIAEHLRRHPAPDAAIVLEPTGLRVVNAHNGVVRATITVHGRAAHTSTANLGLNAIDGAVEVITLLQRWHRTTIRREGGQELLTVSLINGGEAVNIVPDRCRFALDIRTAPDRDAAALAAELGAFLRGVEALGHRIDLALDLVDGGMFTAPEERIVVAAAGALAGIGRSGATAVVPFGTDASKLGRAGTPSIVLGPGSIDQAHADDEWVELAEVEAAADAIEAIIRRYDAEEAGR
jgi:acetylornithine deacetylase